MQLDYRMTDELFYRTRYYDLRDRTEVLLKNQKPAEISAGSSNSMMFLIYSGLLLSLPK